MHLARAKLRLILSLISRWYSLWDSLVLELPFSITFYFFSPMLPLRFLTATVVNGNREASYLLGTSVTLA